MPLVFDTPCDNDYLNYNCFNGIFIDQDSYINLLRICDKYFDLDMTSSNRKLPCQRHSYMLLSKNSRDLIKGVGKNASINVKSIFYSSQYNVLACIVQMKNNFTCNKIPHVILAKGSNVKNNALASSIVNELNGTIEDLYTPIKIRGRIGLCINTLEEILDDISIVNGISVQESNNIVTRPEAMFTVEHPPPPSTVRSVKQFKESQLDCEDEDKMKITLSKGETETGETYQGEPVIKGPRGGKYIIKEGKKKWVHKKLDGQEKADVVYKINILKDQIEDNDE